MSGLEIELKAGLSPAEARKLQRCLISRHGPALPVQMLRTLYFDMADERFAKAGFALRIRREAGRSVQTVKAGRRLLGGFQQVQEIDTLVKGLTPRIAAVPDCVVRERLLRLAAGEVPALRFETRVRRTRWQVRAPGGLVEVALDRGHIVAGAARHPILELELELLGGSPAALFSLAGDLLGGGAAWLSIPNKAVRGAALAREQMVVPGIGNSKPKAPALLTPASVAFATGLQRLAPAIATNLHMLLTNDTPEGPHQLRVALRRLRTLLKLHRRGLKRGLARELSAEARRLGQIVSPLRDADVLVPALLDAAGVHREGTLRGPLLELVHRQRAATRQALCAAEATGFALKLMEFAVLGGWQRHGKGASIEDRAWPVLNGLWREIFPRGDALAWLPKEERHELRKLLKKLRYTLELIPKDRNKEFTSTLKRLQEDLGNLNDIAVLEHWNPMLEPAETLDLFREVQAGFAARSQHRVDVAMGRACRHWLTLRDCDLPWQTWRP